MDGLRAVFGGNGFCFLQKQKEMKLSGILLVNKKEGLY